MGNQCCSGRDNAYKRKAQENAYGGKLKNMLSFGAEMQLARIGVWLACAVGDDVVRFDRAYDNNDIAEFVKLCNSTCEDEIREAGGIEVLVKLLASKELDRKHAAVVALSFLSVDNVKYKRAFMKNGGIAQLVRFLDIPPNAPNVYTQLEAIYHLEDLVGDENAELPEFVQAVKAAGAIPKLKKLQEVRFSNKLFFRCLSSVQEASATR
ncbi:hypothetical protein ACSSS7_003666 [Eimeria intestinalis]